jgi:hypothetical protein
MQELHGGHLTDAVSPLDCLQSGDGGGGVGEEVRMGVGGRGAGRHSFPSVYLPYSQHLS